MATLWSIPDAETADLMTHFWANMARSQGKAEALCAAQRAMLKSRRDEVGAAHPFY